MSSLLVTRQPKEKTIVNAMNKITSQTNNCIKFVARTSQSSYLNIKSAGGCWSYVGRLPSSYQPQELSLDRNGCVYQGTAIHELMHAIGFEHEQSRPDRDSFVKIYYENIESKNAFNFDKYTTSQVSTLGLPYDYYSNYALWI